jgi:RimJ/RimL family protein N-acetyltransferase
MEWTKKQPDLRCRRIILRPFRASDAKAVYRLAGDDAVTDTTLNIPNPYREEMAEEWISSHASKFAIGEAATFAIVTRFMKTLIGAIGLVIENRFERAEMGYWIGKPYWNKGFCTEAGQAVLAYTFEELNLNRVYAHHFARNPASGRVMEKLGMIYEGRVRQHVKKGDRFEDLELYGILRSDWNKTFNTQSKGDRHDAGEQGSGASG